MSWERDSVDTQTSQLVRLVYELLDAHQDTARLAEAGPALDVRWQAHLGYLQALQRVSREVLAGALASHSEAW